MGMSSSPSVAASLSNDARKRLAILSLSKTGPIACLADREGVSRQFVYRQKQKAAEALDEAFAVKGDDILFHLPVTEAWLNQLTLALILICRSSYRGVKELLRDLFNIPISVGTIHNRLQSVAAQACAINRSQNLSAIRVGLHDEISQGSMPVLAGVDAASTYCYLLADAEHRDADTWAVHLLDANAQGFDPDHTIADAGQGLRSGQKAALAGIAQDCDAPLYLVRDVCLLQRKSPSSNAYWQRWNLLHKKLGGKFQRVVDAVVDAMKNIPRASSLVENLNSRLRNYFFLRRQLGAPYLNLLQFFLNHRTFLRSQRPERVGKSPKELMTGQSHPHWLELLGFTRFQLP